MTNYPVNRVTLDEFPGLIIDVLCFDVPGVLFIACANLDKEDIERAMRNMVGFGYKPIKYEFSYEQAMLMLAEFWRSDQRIIKGSLVDLSMPGFESEWCNE